MEKIYLDYAASTPVDPRVFEAMRPYFTEKFGNPGSLHSFGQEAIAAVDKSRETIAKALGADFREVIFTGSATEANNLALRGVIKRFEYRISNIEYPRIIISAIEHESVLETARDLEREGIEVVYLPVDRRGVVDLEKLKEALNERTVLVSIMHANNEIGTAQPLFEIHRIIEDFKKRNSSIPQFLNCPLLHSDCAQAFQFLDCDVDALGVDLMTLSAHKIYGPKGIGALYVRQGKEKNVKLPDSRFQILDSIATGGGQEFGLRSGTENVPLIVGFAKAVELAIAVREKEARRIGDLRDRFWAELKKNCPKAELNGFMVHGSQFIDKTKEKNLTLPNILNVCFPNHLAETLLTKLDIAGLAVSAGSACRSRAVESSYVIEALGYPGGRAKRSVRFSFGRQTTDEEVRGALDILRGNL